MRILVTGGAGFIGSKICYSLHSSGHSVVAIDNLSTGSESRVADKGFDFMKIDILDSDSLHGVFRDGVDLVIHCAAQKDVRYSISCPIADCMTNIIGSIQLMEAMVRHGCGRIIFLSSAGALYLLRNGETHATEDSLVRPVSPYGLSKLAFEQYLHYYKKQYGIKYAILRLANVYGADDTKSALSIFKRLAIIGERINVNGGGQIRDFIHVSDVVSAVRWTINREGVYNVGTGTGTSIIDAANLIRKIYDPHSRSEIIISPMVKGEVVRSVVSPERLYRTGWWPRVGLIEGLETVDNSFVLS